MAIYRKDYNAILAGLKKVTQEIETMCDNAKKLQKEADAAESVLQDDVAKKNISAMREIAEAINKATADGVDRVRELEKKVQIEKDEWERLHSQSR